MRAGTDPVSLRSIYSAGSARLLRQVQGRTPAGPGRSRGVPQRVQGGSGPGAYPSGFREVRVQGRTPAGPGRFGSRGVPQWVQGGSGPGAYPSGSREVRVQGRTPAGPGRFGSRGVPQRVQADPGAYPSGSRQIQGHTPAGPGRFWSGPTRQSQRKTQSFLTHVWCSTPLLHPGQPVRKKSKKCSPCVSNVLVACCDSKASPQFWGSCLSAPSVMSLSEPSGTGTHWQHRRTHK